MAAMYDELLRPNRVFTRSEVLDSPSAVPAEPGVYAWYVDAPPHHVPLDGCHRSEQGFLLYAGISPKEPSSDGRQSNQNLRKRLRNHYRGNASGSTLRLTLGCLLEAELSIRLQPTPSGRLTFGSGEDVLSDWMEAHTRVTWLVHAEPWRVEHGLIAQLSLPLNLDQNSAHPFHDELSALRRAARSRARGNTTRRALADDC